MTKKSKSSFLRSLTTRTGSLRERVGSTARRNLNTVLDVVDEFERKGGFRALVEEGARASERALVGGPYDAKSLRQYYANLEVPYGSDRGTVKRSYRRLMRKYHPDRHSGDPERERLATELSQELTRAYDAVLDHLKQRNH